MARSGRPADLEPHRHPLGQLGHVGDDADHAAAGAEVLHRSATTSSVSASRVPKPSSRNSDSSRGAPAGAGHLLGESQRQGQRGQERLAAGQRAGQAGFVGVPVVDHDEPPALVHRQRVGGWDSGGGGSTRTRRDRARRGRAPISRSGSRAAPASAPWRRAPGGRGRHRARSAAGARQPPPAARPPAECCGPGPRRRRPDGAARPGRDRRHSDRSRPSSSRPASGTRRRRPPPPTRARPARPPGPYAAPGPRAGQRPAVGGGGPVRRHSVAGG